MKSGRAQPGGLMGYTREQKRRFSLQACFVTAILCIALAPTWLRHAPKADQCTVSANGKVVPTRFADGLLLHQGGMFFVQREGENYSFLPVTWPSSKGPHDETWHRAERLVSALVKHTGEVVHVEICGRTVLQIDADGNNAFATTLRTQQDLDGEFASRNFPLRFGSLLCFVAFLCSITLWSINRRVADQFSDSLSEET
jgi:hypothetical protein